VFRFETGNLGDHRAVGQGAWERLRPGVRIYFAKARKTIVLLLLCGDKSSQRGDIRRAREYWAEYRNTPWHAEVKTGMSDWRSV